MSDTPRPDFWLPAICMGFLLCLVVGFILPVKLMQVGFFTLPGGAFIFPWTYAFSAIVTEVWGYSTTRRMIWLGLLAIVIMVIAFWLTDAMHAAESYHEAAMFHNVFHVLPRIAAALGASYVMGEFINAIALSRTKIRLDGQFSAVRLYIAPVVSQLVVYAVFIPFTYGGLVSKDQLLVIIGSRILWAALYHAGLIMLMVRLAAHLKRCTHLDAYDVNVSLNPFHF